MKSGNPAPGRLTLAEPPRIVGVNPPKVFDSLGLLPV